MTVYTGNIATCKFCDPPQKIHPNADEFGKWHPTNMDDTKHEHIKAYPKSTQGQTMRQSYPDTAPPTTDENDEAYDDKMRAAKQQQQPQQQPQQQEQSSSKQQFFNQRDADIKQAHQENIKATADLILELRGIKIALNNLLKLGNDYLHPNSSMQYEFRGKDRENPQNDP